MKKAVIIHGMPSKEEYYSDKFPACSNSHWIPWLQKQLMMRDIITQTPEMPEAYSPDYEKWRREFERYDLDKETVLIGHSCGGGFLIRWLSENKLKIGKLVLVAPWMDLGRKETGKFFDFEVDKGLEKRVGEMDVLVSEDESTEGVKETVELLEEVLIEIKVHRFKNRGHFTLEEMGTEKFPELLEIAFG
jgi:predicted alpha/beta hydrolase family esterase